VASKRPIVVAGHDAAHARTELVDLARRSGSLLATTCRAKDLFVGEKEYLGLFGLTSSEEAICLMMESDCIMFFGASVEMHENPDQILAKAKSVFWFDRHSKSFNPRRERKLAFNGDPALAADHLREHLDARNIPPRKYPSDQRLPVRAFAAPYKAKSYALFHEFLLAAEKIVPANRILVTDASRYSSAAQRILSVQNPNLHLQSWARGSVGAGVPTALGAAFADLKKTVLLITTVSGFMSEGIADFQTAVRNSIDLIVVLCNDGESGSDFERYSKARFEKDLMHYQLPDFVEVAASLGGTGHNIKSTDALGALPAIIAKRNRPILLNLDLQDRSSHRLSEPYPMSVSGHHRLQLVADRH
jgi:thiamine pyrophosphate-dependent acetolactate synthase large subunit-like protein